MRLLKLCVLALSSCQHPPERAITPVLSSAESVYRAVFAADLRTDHLLVAETTLPMNWGRDSSWHVDPSVVNLHAMGLAIPSDARWVATPPIGETLARGAYFAQLYPLATVQIFSPIAWNAAHTAAAVGVQRISCESRCFGGGAVYFLELRDFRWVVLPRGITIRN